MPRSTWRAVAAIALLSMAPALAAQPGATVRGVVYDSLRGRPLAAAFVTLDGTRSTNTDARGRFQFDSVPAGERTLAAQHSALDSAGLSGLAARVRAGDGAADAMLATPSFATLWRSVCGNAPPAADTGLVFGVVTDAGGERPLRDATVRVSWMKLAESVVRDGDWDQVRAASTEWHAMARTGPNGTFGVCGVPSAVAVRIIAGTDSAASGVVDLAADPSRVRRRDLRLTPVLDSATTPRGVVAGTVTDTAGRPVPNTRVIVHGAPEARGDDDGRFSVRGVPAGTRQLEVFALGMSPGTAVVDVAPDATVAVALRLRKVTTLDVVRVVAAPRMRRLIEDFEHRRRVGVGHFRDSTTIGRVGMLSSVFATIPSIDVVRERGTSSGRFTLLGRGLGNRVCQLGVYIDGLYIDGRSRDVAGEMEAVRPTDISAIEVYPRALQVPAALAAHVGTCGVVQVWTKRAFDYRFTGAQP